MIAPEAAASPGDAGGFRKLAERVVHVGQVISLAEGTYLAPDGRSMKRDVVRHPGAVAVVAVDGGEVLLVRQYRAAPETELLELPAGKLDVAGESPERAALRELQEEIGYTSGTLEKLASFYNSAGFSDEYSQVFLATQLRQVESARSGPEEEWMTTVRVPLDEVASMIERGEIVDAKTIIGLLLALRRLRD